MFLTPRPVPMIIKDDSPLNEPGHYYWEICVSHGKYRYASDGWFGIGTPEITQLDATRLMHHNVSKDNFWGYGSSGTITHNNETIPYGPHFYEGDILGAHVDLYNGTIEFHRNKKPLGIAYTGIPTNIPLYPVLIGATAVPSPSDVNGPHKFLSSLQLLCYRQITLFKSHNQVLNSIPPGLKQLANHFEFLHSFTGQPAKPELYCTKYEMVIVSDEEENWPTKPRRKRKPATALKSFEEPSCSFAVDLDDDWMARTLQQRREVNEPVPGPSGSKSAPSKNKKKSTKTIPSTVVKTKCKTKNCVEDTSLRKSSRIAKKNTAIVDAKLLRTQNTV